MPSPTSLIGTLFTAAAAATFLGRSTGDPDCEEERVGVLAEVRRGSPSFPRALGAQCRRGAEMLLNKNKSPSKIKKEPPGKSLVKLKKEKRARIDSESRLKKSLNHDNHKHDKVEKHDKHHTQDKNDKKDKKHKKKQEVQEVFGDDASFCRIRIRSLRRLPKRHAWENHVQGKVL